ncbi:MAG: class I SAM-dependent methyltransferase [Planctomycetota bacterium]|nr:class I SAM-dependent methyltransferase [Planctomycetota bacterium]
MEPPETPSGSNKARWPNHRHDLIHTFGVEDYDAYWNALPMRKQMRSIHKRMIREILKLVPPPAKLLELGPGPGHLYWALDGLGYEMYACDVSKVALDALQAPSERVRQADLNSGLPDFGTTFQVILAAMVLHHIIKPNEFLAQLRDAVCRNGFLVLTIPNIISLKNRMRMLAGKFPHLSPSHRNFMTPLEVKELMERNNLKSVRVISARRKPLELISPTLFSKELIVIAKTIG